MTALTDNRFAARLIVQFGIENFDESSRSDLEFLIELIDLRFENIEGAMTRELIETKKAAIAVRDQYESLGYSLPNYSVTSHNGIRIFEGVNAA